MTIGANFIDTPLRKWGGNEGDFFANDVLSTLSENETPGWWLKGG